MKILFAVGLALTVSFGDSPGAVYNGNGDTSFGGTVGNGSLTLTDNGTTVSGTFTRGTGHDFSDNLVIFIDSKSGGYSTTSGFNDAGSTLRKAISGVDANASPNRAVADFASGFSADYAIVLRPRSPTGSSDGLFQLMNTLDHTFLGSVNLSPTANQTSSTYTFSFNWSDIGVIGGQGASFKFESSYIGIGANNDSVIRSLESFESLASDPDNSTRVIFSTFDTYTAVPEMTNAALTLFGGIALFGGAFARTRRFFQGWASSESRDAA
jgi:hypothetical protein